MRPRALAPPRGPVLLVLGALSAQLPAGCAAQSLPPINMTIERAEDSPKDAAVYIDERFVGLLGVIAARGVRLPPGQHRITIERTGYFPWDELVTGEDERVHLRVHLVRIPD